MVREIKPYFKNIKKSLGFGHFNAMVHKDPNVHSLFENYRIRKK